jgi:hypothetical protein
MIQASIRKAESLAELNVLREDIATWQDYWEDSRAVRAHRTQLTLLTDVLDAVITDIEEWARNEFDLAADAGQAYAACGKADKLTLHARRLWRWYADKIDQLRDEPTNPEERTVRAADELIWSCWKTAWTHLRTGEPPAAPIPYLEAEFAASATPRDRLPQGIRPGDADEPLKKHIALLPIPVIALPSACTRRPWWLIVAAHETGHLVQDQLTLVQDTVVDLERNAGDDAGLWGTWGQELFADAFSVLLAGPAAIWAIAELEMRADINYLPAGVSLYPPPLVRVEVANEVARQVGITGYDPGFPPTPHDDQIARLIAHAPSVASALLGLLGSAGQAPNALGTQTADAFKPGGSIAIWRDNLLSNETPLTERSLSAARFCACAGVAAWQGIARDVAARQRLMGTDLGEPELLAEADRLAERVLLALPDCREPTTRAAGPARMAAGEEISNYLARQIFEGMLRNEREYR